MSSVHKSSKKTFLPFFADNNSYEYDITPPASPVQSSSGELLTVFIFAILKSFYQLALAFVKVQRRNVWKTPTRPELLSAKKRLPLPRLLVWPLSSPVHRAWAMQTTTLTFPVSTPHVLATSCTHSHSPGRRAFTSSPQVRRLGLLPTGSSPLILLLQTFFNY